MCIERKSSLVPQNWWKLITKIWNNYLHMFLPNCRPRWDTMSKTKGDEHVKTNTFSEISNHGKKIIKIWNQFQNCSQSSVLKFTQEKRRQKKSMTSKNQPTTEKSIEPPVAATAHVKQCLKKRKKTWTNQRRKERLHVRRPRVWAWLCSLNASVEVAKSCWLVDLFSL